MTEPPNEVSFLEDLKHKYINRFKYYKILGDQTLDRLSEDELHWLPTEHSNSVAIIAKHCAGNMLSRWTDFLTTDGEKLWRNRDSEFEDDIESKTDLLTYWEKGWKCLFNAIENLSESDFHKKVFIRNEPHTVPDAINRQLAHYAYHVGQMVFIGKMIMGENWKSLSIPKNSSEEFNRKMNSKTNKNTG